MWKKKTGSAPSAFLLAISAVLLLISCVTSNPSPEASRIPIQPQELPQRGFFLGYAAVLPPDGNFEMAYQQASRSGDFVSVWGSGSSGGPWSLAQELEGGWGEVFLDGLIIGNDLFPLIQMSFISRDQSGLILSTPPELEGATLSDPNWRQAYLEAAVEVALTSQTQYFSPGNEVNRWYEQYGAEPGDPNGFQHFVSLYEEIYAEIKTSNPELIIFPVFAREIVSENREADISVLEMFDPETIDLLALTTYPFAVDGISKAADLPDNYYAKVLDQWKDDPKPIAFTEAAWSTLPPFGGEGGQADFLQDLTGRLTTDQGLELHLLGWFSLFDLVGDPHQVGLITEDGREKPAYLIWLEY